MTSSNDSGTAEERRNGFGGRFTNMKDQLESDVYDAANSVAGGVVMIHYSKLERIVALERLKAAREEAEYSRLAIWHPDAIRYLDKRIAELDKQIKELSDE